jgi:hypothetical protein
MGKESKEQARKSKGLWIPNHIRNIPRSVLNDLGKKVLAHIYSFGKKGCYQSNKTIGEIFMVSARTISRAVTAMKKAGKIHVKCPKGYYRTMWAKSHPDVIKAAELHYRDKKIPKTEVETGHKLPTPARQNCPTQLDKSGEVTATDEVFRLGQNCPTTNTKTNKETKKETTAPPPPLPAGGQAPALLEERKARSQAQAEKIKRKFGSGGGSRTPGLTPQEFEERRHRLKRDLLEVAT